MQREWLGHYLDGQTANRHPATIRLMQEGLEVSTPGGWSMMWPYRDIRLAQGRYEGEEVRLERGGQLPEALIVADRAFLSSFREAREAAPGRGRWLGEPGHRARRVQLTAIAGLAAVAIAAALYLWGIPVLAALAAFRVPVAWEESLGRAVLGQVAPADRICVDPGRQQALDSILSRLVAADTPTPYRYRLLVVDRPEVNAFAVPGGGIVVLRGLLERTRTPDELAGVLAHEIEHIRHRDSTRMIIQVTSTGLLLAALTGDVTGPLAYGLEGARVLGQLQYSRRAEDDADRDGMKLLLAARIDPQGMIGFFDELGRDERAPAAPGYLSTHPPTGDRIAALRALANGAHPARDPLLAGRDWSDVRAICAGRPGRSGS